MVVSLISYLKSFQSFTITRKTLIYNNNINFKVRVVGGLEVEIVKIKSQREMAQSKVMIFLKFKKQVFKLAFLISKVKSYYEDILIICYLL